MTEKIEKIIYSFSLPIKTVSESNVRGHWAVKARRAQKQRRDAYYCCREYIFPFLRNIEFNDSDLLKIKLIREASKVMDGDNLATSMKAVRDGIADFMQIDDGDSRLIWKYDQAILKGAQNIQAIFSILKPK